MIKQNCLFCSIATGLMESATVFENNDFKVVLDRFPAAPGHTLIMTKEHVDNIFDLDAETAAKMFALATVVARSLKKAMGCDGMNILQNSGAVAGQTVHHFHLHLIPRFENDDLSFKWKTKAFQEDELEEIARNIQSEM
ncbi:HIT family protein [Anaerotalea alkaliphila]|uniref:HIT family protein n=1 Tax=Anaerotalea alkaliphila TaxID=2662126 RepID=A0A7X5HU05_9FIRM|nr:HIT family protein [Anaerotalea alkaliphila]NDL66386.1 HIT family protein [Anaerotalea alkaliphila]